jgi:hypothetical protein
VIDRTFEDVVEQTPHVAQVHVDQKETAEQIRTDHDEDCWTGEQCWEARVARQQQRNVAYFTAASQDHGKDRSVDEQCHVNEKPVDNAQDRFGFWHVACRQYQSIYVSTTII